MLRDRSVLQQRELFCRPGKQQDLDPASQAPLVSGLWQASSHGVKVAPQGQQAQRVWAVPGLVRALCHLAVTPLPGEP